MCFVVHFSPVLPTANSALIEGKAISVVAVVLPFSPLLFLLALPLLDQLPLP